MTTTRQLDLVVTERHDSAGSMVWWNLSGSVLYADIVVRLKAAGVPDKRLPYPVGPTTALTRAMRRFEDRRHFIRPRPDSKRGWTLVREHVEGGEHLSWESVGSVRLGEGGSLDIDGAEHIREELVKAFHEEQASFSTEEVSMWLSRSLIPILSAVSLRPCGGFYFIPYQSVEQFRREVACLPGEFCEVPAMRTKETVKAVLDSLAREAAAGIDAIFTELSEGGLGSRALNTRKAECERMAMKLSEYEGMLGASLPIIASRLEQLQAAVTQAVLAEAADANIAAAA